MASPKGQVIASHWFYTRLRMRFGASSTSATSNALPRYASFELCKKSFQPGQASQRPIDMLSNDQLTMWLRKEVQSLAQISVATWNQGGVHATLRTLVVRFLDYNPPSSRNLRVGGIGLPQWQYFLSSGWRDCCCCCSQGPAPCVWTLGLTAPLHSAPASNSCYLPLLMPQTSPSASAAPPESIS